jgi:hypothetical protein
MNQERIYDKLDDIVNEIRELYVLTAKNTTILEEHMRRTAALEAQVDILKDTIVPIRKSFMLFQVVVTVTASIATILMFVDRFHLADKLFH